MALSVEVAVLGAGVVGLACARRLALAGKEVMVVEAASAFGTETSARNSEVIHAGIYYPKGSLKAQMCVAGKQQLYRYCKEKAIPHRQVGKVIVATCGDEVPALHRIHSASHANGVTDVEFIGRDGLRGLEPGVEGVDALFSPSTGVVDSHHLMLSLLGDAEDHGATLALNTKVLSGRVTGDNASIELKVADVANPNEPFVLTAGTVINSCGLHAPLVAKSIVGHSAPVPKPFYCKGSYFSISGHHPFNHLVYPVPNNAGLGVHVTLDLAGQAKFGPDTEWIDSINYNVSDRRLGEFETAIRRYWPGLPDGALQPSYSGIRPKIVGPKEPAADFLIQGPSVTRARLVNLLGIESPGLTSCLAIADHVAALLGMNPLEH